MTVTTTAVKDRDVPGSTPSSSRGVTRGITRGITRGDSEFGPLLRQIRAAGLLERRLGYYAGQTAFLLGGTAAVWLGVVALAHSWWALLLAPLLGLMSAQSAFLGHDAGHQQIARTRPVNRRLGLLYGNVSIGMSYGWWLDKHNRHHANPNHEGLDPDVGEGVLVWTEQQAGRRRGFGRWFARHQAWMFFPLLTLEGFNLKVSGLRALAERPRRARRVEALLLVLHYLVYGAALLLLLSPGQALLFVLIHQAVFGVHLGMAFAPNHKGMPMPPVGSRWGHLRKQVLTSRDVRGGPVVDFMLGGLNYQVEHHLVPNLPRPHLRRAQPIVRAYCADIGVRYVEVGVRESYRQALGHLDSVGG